MMHYYQHNIADYRKDTTHLSLLEHGIYRRLLDQYYLDETPISLDHASVMRSHSVRNADEMQAFENVLKDFFFRTDEGYIHKRCDVEIEAFHAKSKSTSESAKARWARVREEKSKDAMQSHSESNANHKPLTTNQEPLTNNQKPETKTKAKSKTLANENKDDVVKIFDFWKKIMHSPTSVFLPARKALIERTLKHYCAADICKAIRGCSKTPHNMGENDRNTKFNSIELILRDAAHIERFIATDSSLLQVGPETSEQRTARLKAQFLGESQNDDQNTIEMEG